MDRLHLMLLFRLDMAGIEQDRTWSEGEPHPAFKRDPLAFKYVHSEFLFKVWCAGRNSAQGGAK